MRTLRKLCNYFFYCGIEKEEYNALKKDAYVSNFVVWRILHYFMAAFFFSIFVVSLFNNPLHMNRFFYLISFIYSIMAIIAFMILKPDSIIAQFIIYLSISFLFLLGCIITKNNPFDSATSFIAFLLITPMLMIDKPFFMAIELSAASTLLLVWMYYVKPHDVWLVDLVNVIIFTLVGIFLNIIANSIRIREFVLTHEIKIQKDTDDLTGLKNKGALTRKINNFLLDPSTNKGIMLMLDIDHFKAINDTYGHDIGDDVITQLGHFLGNRFVEDEIVGRFGGDEFIVFIKNTNDEIAACQLANDIIQESSEFITLPEEDKKVQVSIGIAIYNGQEKSYSEIFKKADTALYRSKANPNKKFYIYE